jgi:hypothetical protein
MQTRVIVIGFSIAKRLLSHLIFLMGDPTESAFTLRGTNYRLKICLRESDTFEVILCDDDMLERWSATFDPVFIQQVTLKAGSVRTPSVFWKMLHHAVSGTSSDISFDILSPQDIAKMSTTTGSSVRINSNTDNMYLIVSYLTSFDQLRCPLPLRKNPYTPDEWKAIVRALKAENKKLQSQPAPSSQLHSLESQITHLTMGMRKLSDDKNRVIDDLTKKISGLEKALAQARARHEKPSAPRKPPPRNPSQGRRGSVGSSASNSKRGSRNSSAQNSARSSSTGSKGSFKRFDPTGWVRSRQGSASSKGSGRKPSPGARAIRPAHPHAAKGDANLNRIRAMVNQRYKY